MREALKPGGKCEGNHRTIQEKSFDNDKKCEGCPQMASFL
jgi:hypothetical protein